MTTAVVFATYWGGHAPGETVSLDSSEARSLICRGIAREADAPAVDVPPADPPAKPATGTKKPEEAGK